MAEADSFESLESRVGVVEGRTNGTISRHPVAALSLALVVLTGLWSGLQWYAQRAVAEAITERKLEGVEGALKSVEEEVTGIQTGAAEFKREAAKAHETLGDGIRDVGRLQLEQGRDQRRVLESMSRRQLPDKLPGLTAAEAKVENFPETTAGP